MSKSSQSFVHQTDGRPEGGHGTAKSYIIGFVLSLVFTVIPYNLVVNQSVTGDTLLAVILGIGVLQMIIQVVFFLHLGRERKPRWQLYFFIGTVGGITTVVGGSVFIMSQLHHNMAPTEVSKKLAEDEGIYQVGGEKTGACKGRHTIRKVMIMDGVVTPALTKARYCDTLTFVNHDERSREITFGAHPQHASYAGQTELTLRQGRSKSIVLNQPGSYQFHDHLDPDAAGYFTVTP